MTLTSGFAQADGRPAFSLEQLPRGAEVTLPQPTIVSFAADGPMMVSATDSPQTLRITAAPQTARPVRISIYDQFQDRVRYVDVRPGVQFLYNFRKLSTITIVADKRFQTARGARLEVASDKPITVRH